MKTLSCKNCSVSFQRKRIYKKSVNSFCSRSCAVTYNNTIFIKRKKSGKNICKCNGVKDYRAKYCHRCKIANTLNKALSRTIKDASSKGNARIKYGYIREIAHNVMAINNISKQCRICEFDIVLDVCHIKPISEFSEDDYLYNVNSITNLTYLCPNHHRMLDDDLLSLI